jgi:hypothetical protein
MKKQTTATPKIDKKFRHAVRRSIEGGTMTTMTSIALGMAMKNHTKQEIKDLFDNPKILRGMVRRDGLTRQETAQIANSIKAFLHSPKGPF